MYICVCHGVTESQIRDEVLSGAESLCDLSAKLGVATCCGTCSRAAEQVIQETCHARRGSEALSAFA